MKSFTKLTLIAALCAASAANAATLQPGQQNFCNFETTQLEIGTSNGNGDMTFDVVANPLKEGVNQSPLVGHVLTGSAPWELLWTQPTDHPFAFSLYGTKFYLTVLAPEAGLPVYLKLESSSGAPALEVADVVSGTAGQWVTLEYDFARFNPADNTYDKFVILFNAGNAVAGQNWYFDDLIGPKAEVVTPQQPDTPAQMIDFCNFEDRTIEFNINDADLPMAYEIIENPFKEGINTSDHVGHVTSGGHQWELLWSTPMELPMKFSESAVFTMKVRSPKPDGIVFFKLEGDGVGAQEITNVRVPEANTWTELTYDFSSRNLPDNAYNKIVLLFDAGQNGEGENWYFDDIKGPDNGSAGIETLSADSLDNAPAIYFNLQGIQCPASSLQSGIYLRRQGQKVSKVIIK